MPNTTLSPGFRTPARSTAAAALGALSLAGPMAAGSHAVATGPAGSETGATNGLARSAGCSQPASVAWRWSSCAAVG
jgi:hypothetical protein